MTDTSAQISIRIDGPVTLTFTGAATKDLVDMLPSWLAHASVTATTAGAELGAELPVEAAVTPPPAAVDISAEAVEAANAAAMGSGWTVDLATEWVRHDSQTGRTALQCVVAAGGVAAPAEMAGALDRNVDAKNTFTGVFSGTGKRWALFQSSVPSAEDLAYPFKAVYDDANPWRQTAGGFALVDADALDVFRIALATFDADAAAA